MRKDSHFIILSIFVIISSLIPRESLCAEATKVIIGMDAPTLSDLPLMAGAPVTVNDDNFMVYSSDFVPGSKEDVIKKRDQSRYAPPAAEPVKEYDKRKYCL